jgi:branched-chain amino acid transport system ATP-binding protein
MPDGSLLELAGISKRFGGVQVIDDLSIAVRPDELVGVVGPNGAGKTTLFSMITGAVRPDTGSVVFDGKDVTSVPVAGRCRAGIGRTHQIPRPFTGMTAFENVLVGAAHGAGARGRSAYRGAMTALEAAGLDAKANVQAADLGLLDRKRLELARALATGPRLLLLDEVAGGLTEPEVADLLTVVLRLREQGIAIVWIEHIVDALISVANRLVCLAGGRLIADGKPAEVLASREVQEVYLGTTEPAGHVQHEVRNGSGADGGQR